MRDSEDEEMGTVMHLDLNKRKKGTRAKVVSVPRRGELRSRARYQLVGGLT